MPNKKQISQVLLLIWLFFINLLATWTHSVHDVSGLQHQMQDSVKFLTAHQLYNIRITYLAKPKNLKLERYKICMIFFF